MLRTIIKWFKYRKSIQLYESIKELYYEYLNSSIPYDSYEYKLELLNFCRGGLRIAHIYYATNIRLEYYLKNKIDIFSLEKEGFCEMIKEDNNISFIESKYSNIVDKHRVNNGITLDISINKLEELLYKDEHENNVEDITLLYF